MKTVKFVVDGKEYKVPDAVAKYVAYVNSLSADEEESNDTTEGTSGSSSQSQGAGTGDTPETTPSDET